MNLSTYGKIYQLDHLSNKNIFDAKCYVQEKLDGSQFSFMVDEDGDIHCRSNRSVIDLNQPDSLFKLAVDSVIDLYEQGKLVTGWIYRTEAITSPKHNVLNYKTIPPKGFVLFEVQTDNQTFLPVEEAKDVANSMGVLFAPVYFSGTLDKSKIIELSKNKSCVSDVLIEGVVIRRVDNLTNEYGDVIRAKYVNQAFTETKAYKPISKGKSPIEGIGPKYSNPIRWQKILTKMKEDGAYTRTNKDIGELIKRVQKDIIEEEKEAIKEQLFNIHKGLLFKDMGRGVAEWYYSHTTEVI